MKIDEVNKKLIYELDKNSRVPITQLAKRIGKSKEATRYRINELLKAGVITKFRALVDLPHLGYRTAAIYIIAANIPKKKKELTDYILKKKNLFWIGIGQGYWNIGIAFFVKNNEELFQLKSEIFTKFSDLIIESFVAYDVTLNYFGNKYIHHKEIPPTVIEKHKKLEENKLDELSKSIVGELLLNSRTPLTALSQKYNSTTDIVKNRIKKLEKEKTILSYVTYTAGEKIGYTTYRTFLYFKKIDEKTIKKFHQYCERLPQVKIYIKQIAPWEIDLALCCKDNKEYNKVISDLTEEFADCIKNVETTTVTEEHFFLHKIGLIG